MKAKTDGHKYEYQCARNLKSHGFSNVEVTKGSGDQGIDIIARKNGKKYGIQCKYYSSPVGNHAVQEAYAGAKYYNCDIAVVLTNTTFTKSAKELAKRTDVLLWENNRIPFSLSKFRITKWIGIFMTIWGLFGLIMLKSLDDIKYPSLQKTYIILFTLGGLFGIAGAELLACISYILATIFSIILAIALNKSVGSSTVIMFLAFLFSFLRVRKLYAVPHTKTKEDRNVISETHDDDKEILNNSKAEMIESIQKKIDDCLRDMGNSYVTLFNEHYYIQSCLLTTNIVDDNVHEFIIRCESFEQAKYLVTKESDLNKHLNYIHTFTLLANNTVSLIVTNKEENGTK